jgi:hypothetical protein
MVESESRPGGQICQGSPSVVRTKLILENQNDKIFWAVQSGGENVKTCDCAVD